MTIHPILAEDIANSIPSNDEIDWLSKAHVLVVGAGGFIASSLILTLSYLKCNHYPGLRISILIRRPLSSYPRLSLIEPQIFESILISPSPDSIDLIPSTLTHIYYAASPSTSSSQRKSPTSIVDANVSLLINLLRFLPANAKVIFFSSGEANRLSDRNLTPLNPHSLNSIYSLSKIYAESILTAYYNDFHVIPIFARISHTYGPLVDIDDGHCYSDFFKSALLNVPINLKSDGTGIRPFCYISDTVKALLLLAGSGTPLTAYNIANHRNTVTIRSFATIVDSIASELFHIPRTLQHSENTNEVDCLVDITSMLRLGWKPIIDLSEGVRRSLSYLSSNEHNRV